MRSCSLAYQRVGLPREQVHGRKKQHNVAEISNDGGCRQKAARGKMEEAPSARSFSAASVFASVGAEPTSMTTRTRKLHASDCHRTPRRTRDAISARSSSITHCTLVRTYVAEGRKQLAYTTRAAFLQRTPVTPSFALPSRCVEDTLSRRVTRERVEAPPLSLWMRQPRSSAGVPAIATRIVVTTVALAPSV